MDPLDAATYIFKNMAFDDYGNEKTEEEYYALLMAIWALVEMGRRRDR